MEYGYIDLTKTDDGIATVKMNRPEKRNALCRELLTEVIDAFKALDQDQTVRVIIFTGTGKTFAAGADISAMTAMGPLDWQEYGSLLAYALNVVREAGKPVIGAVNGYAFGGGNALVLACDLVVAADSTKFGQQEINLGFFGGAYILPKLIGRCRAAEITMLGEAYSAQQALDMGLINKIVPLENLYEAAVDMARKLLPKSPIALRFAKESLRFGFVFDIDTAQAYQTALMSVMFGSADLKEGIQAFLQKRSPAFTGR
jgi:enoyl-CoA hydratase/carnithine racemase